MVHDERENRPYKEAAFRFLLEALEKCRREHGRNEHVSGGALLGAIQELAHERYGPLAAMVFREWGISSGGDFGHIVYELIERGVLYEREDDRLQDFMGGRPYEEIFEESYFVGGPDAAEAKPEGRTKD